MLTGIMISKTHLYIYIWHKMTKIKKGAFVPFFYRRICYMARFSIFNMFSKSKKRRSVRRRRRVGGSAADYGVKVWGYDQMADPRQGNVIQAQVQKGGTAPFVNTVPSMGELPSTADMSKQALDMQDASVRNMLTPKMEANVQSDSALPKTGGRRKSKRKYGQKIKNGRRTKTFY